MSIQNNNDAFCLIKLFAEQHEIYVDLVKSFCSYTCIYMYENIPLNNFVETNLNILEFYSPCTINKNYREECENKKGKWDLSMNLVYDDDNFKPDCIIYYNPKNSSEKRKIYKNIKIQENFPNLYYQINQIWHRDIILSEKFIEVKSMHDVLASIKKNILSVINSNNELATELYKYFYANIDKFIDIKNNFDSNRNYNSHREFYFSLCDKYNTPKINYELDYLQHYFAFEMFMFQDYKVLYDESELDIIEPDIIYPDIIKPIIAFSNSTHTLKIAHFRRYFNTYTPKYNVKIYNKETKKSNILHFESNRNFDTYFTILIDFIKNYVDVINDFA